VLRELEQPEEALAAITEAIDIRRTLAQARPAVHQRQLEDSLQVLAWLQGNVDDDCDSSS
jgi:hypothetical protein